ncbi:glycosyltransferase family 2 protein [Leeuwenhoekiella aestuarii]|uniref:Glycosyltransferase 2-like domain-containing protein n=1 Tax=Leeuwenhoekiella aestuarii TaxID=2249426 RepID=A0A4Q0NXT7_9FLAO|nr:glycosyltransferase family 2 protein [Leeuwenhoekiella aestuarii]RXG16834.1 hypothetical protein DSM04_102416 [Leeuwenhoekiella aestuarii]
MELSVIIVNYKAWKALEDCLNSLVPVFSNFGNLEVIIVDNQSGDDEFAIFKSKFPEFCFIQNSGNNGFSNGCNLGATSAKGDFFLFLNPDTTITAKTLKDLFNTYKTHDEIGILSCRQYNENGTYYKQNLLLPNLFTFFGTFRAAYRALNKSKLQQKFTPHNELTYPDWVTGAVVFISKEVFEKIKGWNEDYWLYYEDVDLCKKVLNAGYKVGVLHSTELFHAHGGASRINLKTKALTKTEVIISKHTYISNHFDPLAKIVTNTLLIFSVLIEKSLLSALSFLLLFNIKLKVNRLILINLIKYYLNVLKHKTWISPRAMNYKQNVN